MIIGVVRNRGAVSDEVTAFSTDFTGEDENPLSEGGNWAKAASAWNGVRRVGNVARPAALSSSTDDAYSLCQFAAPDDVEVIVTIDRQGTSGGELEILLRATDAATSVQAYEFLCNVGGAIQIVRWNGAFGQFTDITDGTSPPASIADGDQLRATAVGSTLTFYHRRPPETDWTEIGSAEDDTYTSGKAGISFFLTAGNGGDIDDLGYSHFEVNPL